MTILSAFWRTTKDRAESGKEKPLTYVYPALGSLLDLWFVRLSGVGLGNCFYIYFHAVVLAECCGATIIAPAWFSLNPRRVLRGDKSKRFYWRLFKPFEGEIQGLRKLFIFLRFYNGRKLIEIDGTSTKDILDGSLNIVTSRKFTFQGLQSYREIIRNRLLGIINDPIPPDHSWGQGNFVAVHVRLGDFAIVADKKLASSGTANIRIPLSWYVNLVKALQARYPDQAVRLFSDGKDEELQPLIDLGATICRSGSDTTDLLAMSSASIFVGSNSTYSRWAVFLGNMPSIWLEMDEVQEKPSSSDIPIFYVPIDTSEPALWIQGL